jgi:hypothetical protein
MDEREQDKRALTPALRNLLKGGATSFFKNEVGLRPVQDGPVGPVRAQQVDSPGLRTLPFLGQQAPPQAPAAPPPVQYQKCPGPIQMPDGRVIEPDDYMRLNDICEIMPFLIDAMGIAAQQARGLTPGQRVPLVGQTPGGVQPVPSQTGFGSASFGGGGGAMIGGGGGGGPGPAGPQGQVGPVGPVGPAGPAATGVVDFVVKTDGDFFLAPTAVFVPVPGTLITFTQGTDGVVVFLVEAVLGDEVPGLSNGQIGVRVDGVDFPLVARQNAGIGSEFFVPANSSWSMDLAAGSHTAEVVLRSDLALPFPLGGSVVVQANPTIPLAFTVESPGVSGNSGFSGVSGFSGFSGNSGFSGVSGFSGFSGNSGFSGVSGFSGFSGNSGFSGVSGFSGFSGYSGSGGTDVGASVFTAAVQSIPTGVLTTITNVFTVYYDTDAFFTAGQSKLVIPAGLNGKYLMNLFLVFGANATGYREGHVFLSIGGYSAIEERYVSIGAGDTSEFGMTWIDILPVAEEVIVKVKHTAGVNIDVQVFLQIQKIDKAG